MYTYFLQRQPVGDLIWLPLIWLAFSKPTSNHLKTVSLGSESAHRSCTKHTIPQQDRSNTHTHTHTRFGLFCLGLLKKIVSLHTKFCAVFQDCQTDLSCAGFDWDPYNPWGEKCFLHTCSTIGNVYVPPSNLVDDCAGNIL